MNIPSFFINIFTVILVNSSRNFSNNVVGSTLSFVESWGKNNQDNILDIKVIRSLGENEFNKNSDSGETTRDNVNEDNYDQNGNDEGYDKNRYDALTQDYFDMMESDINKGSSRKINEKFSNTYHKTKSNHHFNNMSNENIPRGFKCEYSEKTFYKKLKNFFKTIDNLTEREIYNLLKLKNRHNSEVYIGGRNMTNRIKMILYHYKIFSVPFVLIFLCFICSKIFSAPGWAPFFGISFIVILIYLVVKFIKCSSKFNKLAQSKFPGYINHEDGTEEDLFSESVSDINEQTEIF
ncbi:Plasmodium exported protein, unknown function [Plasmodium gonderi]|uniref:Pv-fam-d protein n=1 Tax=Plasmodium gonderi TaxID=77519 RepID=A0A1Y1JLA4_PLAGO|nr:Plasmodium exported protein, unknown function [Plasmodium gonderi]GAW83221.1 Plasmodium exported protein, unknown function [Plasmodium gonderi]